MTRAYALRKLLELGPLSRSDIFVITGWPIEDVDAALRELRKSREIEKSPGYVMMFGLRRKS